ncbi:MAG: DUF4410 domain-containing protein [Terrimicrobiaceae bacterium]
MKNLFFGCCLSLAGLLFVSGCSSVSVMESQFYPPDKKFAAPPRIYVKPYTFAEGSLRVDRKGEKLQTFQNEVSVQMAERLVPRLTTHIAPTSILEVSDSKLPKLSWVLEGEFTKINQGSRALRSIVGFGLGGTKMEATTKVYQVGTGKKRELMALIRTSGGSNAEPGAIAGGVFGAGPRAILRAVTSGVSPDSKRTARMITATLSERLVADGATLPGPALRAKRPQN